MKPNLGKQLNETTSTIKKTLDQAQDGRNLSISKDKPVQNVNHRLFRVISGPLIIGERNSFENCSI